MINSHTKVCCLIGDPVAHSVSPAMHNAAFKELNLDYTYLPFRVTAEGLTDAVKGLRALDITGFNVTIPHKVAVMPLLDRLDPLAEKIGAVPISVDKSDPKQQILEYTDGMGADVVFESAGTPSGVIQSMDIVRKGGRVSILGQGHAATEIFTANLSYREIELVGTRAYTKKDWDNVSNTLLGASEDLSHIITHRIPLENAEEGIKLMKAREGMKIILEP